MEQHKKFTVTHTGQIMTFTVSNNFTLLIHISSMHVCKCMTWYYIFSYTHYKEKEGLNCFVEFDLLETQCGNIQSA